MISCQKWETTQFPITFERIRGHSKPHLQVPSVSRYVLTCSMQANTEPLGLKKKRKNKNIVKFCTYTSYHWESLILIYFNQPGFVGQNGTLQNSLKLQKWDHEEVTESNWMKLLKALKLGQQTKQWEINQRKAL